MIARRVLVTLAVAGALLGLALTNLESTRSVSLFDPQEVFPKLSWLGLGFGPLLSGYFVVEVIALVVPPLRWRRVSGATARRPLVVASWALGLCFAALQCGVMARAAGDLGLSVSLMAGTLICWALAIVANRFGLLNGFSVAGLVSVDAFTSLQRVWRTVQVEEASPGVALLAVALLGAAAYTTVWLTRRPALRAELPVRAPPPVSGLGMTASAAAMLSFPMTLANFTDAFAPLSRALMSSQALYVSLWVGLAIGFTVFWSLLFFRPAVVASMWKRWNPETDEVSAVLAARAAMPSALRDALVLNVAFALVMQLVLPGAVSLVGSVMLMMLVFVDGLDELRFRQAHGELVTVYEVSRVAEIDAVLHRLSSKGVVAFARTRHFRAAFQFFGPHLPIEVMVPTARAEEARSALAS
ncbi:MAG: hypothetical protein ABTQ32_08695 [Myxococcaceae bacterium]